jgi:hypothetical protein
MKRWIAFLHNHTDVIAAMGFFTVPTAMLRVLGGFFIIEHGRRRVLQFNTTFNPTGAWVDRQIREAFSYDTVHKYLIFDRDSIFSAAVVKFVKAIGTKPRRIAFRSPWQNPGAERWIGRCRREMLEHVIVFDERHLIRLMHLYIDYYQEDRGHSGLDKDAPATRSSAPRPSPRRTSSRYRESVGSIIATSGVRRHNSRTAAPQRHVASNACSAVRHSR